MLVEVEEQRFFLRTNAFKSKYHCDCALIAALPFDASDVNHILIKELLYKNLISQSFADKNAD